MHTFEEPFYSNREPPLGGAVVSMPVRFRGRGTSRKCYDLCLQASLNYVSDVLRSFFVVAPVKTDAAVDSKKCHTMSEI